MYFNEMLLFKAFHIYDGNEYLCVQKHLLYIQQCLYAKYYSFAAKRYLKLLGRLFFRNLMTQCHVMALTQGHLGARFKK